MESTVSSVNRRSTANQGKRGTVSGSPWHERWRGKAPVLRFGLTFAALMAAYYAIAVTQTFDGMLNEVLRWNALASGALLDALGQGIHTTGTVIRSARFSVNVRRGCDAVEPVWYFAAAVLSFPAPIVRKLAGIAVGALLICAVNVVRIASLFIVGAYYPRSFSTIHLEIWPASLILLATLLWIAWISWVRRTTRGATP